MRSATKKGTLMTHDYLDFREYGKICIAFALLNLHVSTRFLGFCVMPFKFLRFTLFIDLITHSDSACLSSLPLQQFSTHGWLKMDKARGISVFVLFCFFPPV